MLNLRFRNDRDILYPDINGHYRVIKISDADGRRHVLLDNGKGNREAIKAYIVGPGLLSFKTIYPCKKYKRSGRIFLPDSKDGTVLHVFGQYPDYHLADGTPLYIGADRILYLDPVDLVASIRQRHDDNRWKQKKKRDTYRVYYRVTVHNGDYLWIVYRMVKHGSEQRRVVLYEGSANTFIKADMAAKEAKQRHIAKAARE